MRSDFKVYSLCCEAGMEGIPVRKLICDRCKKEIDISFMDKYDIKGSSFVRVYGDPHALDMSKDEDLEYDLCKNCTNQLVEFLKSANLN